MTRRAMDGTVVTDAQVLDVVHAGGAILVVREPAEGADDGRWIADLRERARACGMRLVVQGIGQAVLILDGNCVLPTCGTGDDSPRSAGTTAADQLAEWVTGAVSSRHADSRRDHPSRGDRRLRLVREHRAEPAGQRLEDA